MKIKLFTRKKDLDIKSQTSSLKPQASGLNSKASGLNSKAPGQKLKARYDAAQTTADNARHWAMADSLSADSANSCDIRRKLISRSRYEVANNSYAKGIVLTLANDCIGTGPRLQVLTKDAVFNRKVETAFMDWSRSISLAAKLRTLRMAKTTDGEGFGVLTVNSAITGAVKLDLALVEADRITTADYRLAMNNNIDGIELDRFGNPARYSVLSSHPGDSGLFVNNYDIVDADSMVHWFRVDRPGQHRGIPEITAALPLFAQLRRYTLAVLSAAETAADFAAVLFTDSPANGEAAGVEPMDIIELEKRMATVLPDGWKLGQIKAEQPATSYAEFKREILNEIARCLNLPYNIAACNSSGYNYASGRLDHQLYFKAIRVEQMDLATVVLDKILQAWLNEAMLSSEFSLLRTLSNLPHQWFFDGNEHVDPAKEAKAQQLRLSSNTTTLAYEYGRQGKDWETELNQRAKEKQLMTELGLEH
ncbi:MAG: phage portal protein [Phycisphaerae bacterium]|nr:phage portal protein [Phycisphaerae bacterium]